MLGRPHGPHCDSAGLAGDRAHAAAPAFFRINAGLELLFTLDLHHLYGIELAAVDTVLAPVAQSGVHPCFEPAFGEDFVVGNIAYISGMPDSAAAPAATAKSIRLRGCHPGGIHPLVHQALFFIAVHYMQGFINRDPAAVSPDQRIFRRLRELEAVGIRIRLFAGTAYDLLVLAARG